MRNVATREHIFILKKAFFAHQANALGDLCETTPRMNALSRRYFKGGRYILTEYAKNMLFYLTN